ncbi:MAG TPA: hypothetical protein VLS25_06550 [Dehalococcoidia bacterium]|nr:hypothetical protein [Dehalococcoidia bacterium]
MPAYTPIRDFIDALREGETKITRRIKYLVRNYSSIPEPVLAVLNGWDPNTDPPIPPDVKSLLKGEPGACGSLSDENKLSQDEVDHIDAWEAAEKAKVLAWVKAVKGDPNAEIWWELRRYGPAYDDAYPDPNNPLKITARTYAGRVNLHPLNLGSITYDK